MKIKINHSYKLMCALMLFVITGCGSHHSVVSSSSKSGSGYAAQQEARLVLSDWDKNHNYDYTIMSMEKLSRFRGGGFEQARLTALALVQLEYGDRSAFLQTAAQLNEIIHSYQYVEPQAQHVLTVSYAMQGKASSELPGRGYDSNRVQTIYRLLGVNIHGEKPLHG